MRRTALVVFALVASVAFSQSPGSQPKTVQMKLDRNSRQTVRGEVFNTLAVFPQISSTIGQKGFRPSNPGTSLLKPTVGPIADVDSVFSGARGPTVGSAYPGIDATGWRPPDPDMAVGPTHIVQVVNSSVGFFTKAGALEFQTSADTFFGGTNQTTFIFDPKVIYDRIAQRFIVVFLEQDNALAISNVLFAISDDSNPNGNWFLYRFDVSQVIDALDCWLDYPGLGYNKDGFVIAGNMYDFFQPYGFHGCKFLVVPKTAVLTGSAVTTTMYNNSGASPQMAETVDPTKDTVFGAGRLGYPTTGNQTRFFGFRNLGGVPTAVSTDVVVTSAPWVGIDAESTSGRELDALDGRVLTAIWRNGRLYLSYPVQATALRVGCHWAEYTTGNWPLSGVITEVQVGNHTSGTMSQFMPAINVNKHGDVSMLFTQSSSAVTANVAVAGRIVSDPLNSMSGATVLATSVGTDYPWVRWGDYFGVGVDPVDDETFWGTAMTVRADNDWTTHIFSWSVSKTWPVAPTGFAWLRGTFQSGNAASLAADDGDYNVAKAGLVLFPSEPPAQLQVEATAPAGQVLSLDISVVAKVNTPGLSQKIELWNWENSVWVPVGGVQACGTSDTTHSGSATGALIRYVQVGTGLVRAKVSFYRTGLTLIWPWTASVDQVQWRIRSR